MKKILIVDDHQSIRFVIKKLLCQMDIPMDIHCASDGHEAVQWINKYMPNLVITDIFMPRMDGMELIRHLNASTTRPKIIAMTNSSVTDQGNTLYLDCAKELGADQTILKSQLIGSLATLVEACFDMNMDNAET